MPMENLPIREPGYWDSLYDHLDICEAVLHKGEGAAKALFHRKARHILKGEATFPVETAVILLTSLNRSLYDYLLFLKRRSFAECCYQNRMHTHGVINLDHLLRAGDRVIDAYCACLAGAYAPCPCMEKVCTYVQTHLSEELSLDKVSAALYLSKSHFCALFKALTGVTFCQYVRQARIQRSKQLLSAGPMSIDEIAERCGFHSSTYFSTVFKSETGMSPTAFRQGQRGEGLAIRESIPAS